MNLVEVFGLDDLTRDSLQLSGTTPTAASSFRVRVTSPTFGRTIRHPSPSQTKLSSRFFYAAALATTHFGR